MLLTPIFINIGVFNFLIFSIEIYIFKKKENVMMKIECYINHKHYVIKNIQIRTPDSICNELMICYSDAYKIDRVYYDRYDRNLRNIHIRKILFLQDDKKFIAFNTVEDFQKYILSIIEKFTKLDDKTTKERNAYKKILIAIEHFTTDEINMLIDIINKLFNNAAYINSYEELCEHINKINIMEKAMILSIIKTYIKI